MVQADRIPDDVVMNVRLVNMRADNKSVFPFCESLCQLTAQTVSFFGSNLAGRK